jgi:hypothetical protein
MVVMKDEQRWELQKAAWKSDASSLTSGEKSGGEIAQR